MKQHVVVVPDDQLIIVDTIPLQLEFTVPESLHAIQWHNGTGHTEWTNGPNLPLTTEMYDTEVRPYVEYWEQAHAARQAAAEAAEAERLAVYNSPEARAERVRAERDSRLSATTWLIERHADQITGCIQTTLSESEYTELLAYRQALRDLPQQEGFPWDGINIPFPEKPACLN